MWTQAPATTIHSRALLSVILVTRGCDYRAVVPPQFVDPVIDVAVKTAMVIEGVKQAMLQLLMAWERLSVFVTCDE